MIDHVRAFEEAISLDYQRFNPDDEDDTLPEHQLLENQRGRMHSIIAEHLRVIGPKMLPIYFDYIDNPCLNAKAWVEQKCGYIGMFSGTTSLIFDQFYRLLSHPKILPSIGDCSIETERYPFHSEGIFKDYNALLRSRRGAGRLADVIPRDLARKEYAEVLAQHAMDFLFLHEIGHIAHGHCEYALPNGVRAISEFNARRMRRRAKLDPFVSQALELDADVYAAILTWKYGIMAQNEIECVRRRSWECGNASTAIDELLTFDWAFAVSVMFWMFDQDVNPKLLAKTGHAPGPIRADHSLLSVVGLLQNRSPKDMCERLQPVLLVAIAESRNALIAINNQKLTRKVKEYMDLGGQNGPLAKHLDRVMAKWNEISAAVFKCGHANIISSIV